jgi:hypothetical protein
MRILNRLENMFLDYYFLFGMLSFPGAGAYSEFCSSDVIPLPGNLYSREPRQVARGTESNARRYDQKQLLTGAGE